MVLIIYCQEGLPASDKQGEIVVYVLFRLQYPTRGANHFFTVS